MDGLGILLRAMGVEIEPSEVAQAVNTAKTLIPAIASEFQKMSATQARIEAKLDLLLQSGRLETDVKIIAAIEAVKNDAEKSRVNGAAIHD